MRERVSESSGIVRWIKSLGEAGLLPLKVDRLERRGSDEIEVAESDLIKYSGLNNNKR